ncbi:MAG: birA [Chloroflexi bacterium]|nr:birA [Chloroflexota bacterium]
MLHYHRATASTNDDAASLARAGCPERTIVLANEQTAGRGRLGRSWVAPPGSSLLMSIVLRRQAPSVYLTAACAVAATEAIARQTGIASRIKWPNDLMIGDRKAGGVLTEVIARNGNLATIVGLGLNVNLNAGADNVPDTATSLSAELGRPVAREPMLYAMLERLDVLLGLPDPVFIRHLHARWQTLLWRRQQQVRVDDGRVVLTGAAVGVSRSGALRLRIADGSICEVVVGDVLIE